MQENKIRRLHNYGNHRTSVRILKARFIGFCSVWPTFIRQMLGKTRTRVGQSSNGFNMIEQRKGRVEVGQKFDGRLSTFLRCQKLEKLTFHKTS